MRQKTKEAFDRLGFKCIEATPAEAMNEIAAILGETSSMTTRSLEMQRAALVFAYVSLNSLNWLDDNVRKADIEKVRPQFQDLIELLTTIIERQK